MSSLGTRIQILNQPSGVRTEAEGLSQCVWFHYREESSPKVTKARVQCAAEIISGLRVNQKIPKSSEFSSQIWKFADYFCNMMVK